jgi:hypothetical protein
VFSGVKSATIELLVDDRIGKPCMEIVRACVGYAESCIAGRATEKDSVLIGVVGSVWRKPWRGIGASGQGSIWPKSRVEGRIRVYRRAMLVLDQRFHGESQGTMSVAGLTLGGAVTADEVTPNWPDEKTLWETGSFADVMADVVEKVWGIRPHIVNPGE